MASPLAGLQSGDAVWDGRLGEGLGPDAGGGAGVQEDPLAGPVVA